MGPFEKALQKGKPLPVGTVRMHGGRKMVKTADGWKPQKGTGKPGERGADEPALKHKREAAVSRFLQRRHTIENFVSRELRSKVVYQYNTVKGKHDRATVADVDQLSKLVSAAMRHVKSRQLASEAYGRPAGAHASAVAARRQAAKK